MMKFKRYSPLYNNALLLIVIVILACGPDYPGNYFQGYFMPQSGNTPAASGRYYFSPAFLYENDDDYWDYRDSRHEPDQNLKAWKEYCGIQVSDSMAAQLIYEGKDDPGNPLYKAIQKRPVAWQYLLIARNIQAASAAGGTWWKPVPADTVAMKRLLALVLDSLRSEADPFLKDKYAFQSVKLAHQLHENDSSIALYDTYFGKRKDSSDMKWWSLSHKAGALLDKGDTAQAVYVFAQVFDHCISRRQAAYMSLRMHDIRFVPDALKYCKDNREKAAVYTLCAIQPWQDALPLMEAMVKLTPNHPFLELIMGREINKNESFYFTDPNNNNYYPSDTTGNFERKGKATDYFDKLGKFAVECTDNQNIKDKAFWNTAAAYILYVKGDFNQAKDLLANAKKEAADNSVLAQQIRLQQLLLTTGHAKQASPELEKKVLPMLTALRKVTDFPITNTGFYKTNALIKGSSQLEILYKAVPASDNQKSGWLCNRRKNSEWNRYAPAKALLLTLVSPYSGISDTTSDALLENVIQFFSQVHPTKEDSLFMKLTDLTLNDFYLVKGRRAMQQFEFKAAAEAWKHVADSFWNNDPFKTYLTYDPFASYMLDANRRVGDSIKYTPYTFALRMQQLSGKVKKDPVHAAKYYYQLGCGAYNMSYYGNSWLITKDGRSGSDVPYFITDSLGLADSLNYYTTDKAKAYFDSAMRNAKNDKELAAQACFMAAKCEQNAFYIYCVRHDLWNAISDGFYFYTDNSYKQKKDSLKQLALQLQHSQFNHYFRILENEYSADKFTQEVIRECATYRDFVKGK